MFIMYDSVTLDEIPAEPHAVASYINGRYANHTEAKQRFPHARHLAISVEGKVPADCYDIENGDYSPADAPELLHIAQNAGIWRPCFYANLYTMPTVRSALKPHVGNRDEIRLWVAYYDGETNIPAGYDAHQLTDRALGRNLDESLCLSDFFRPLPKPAPKPTPEPAKPAVPDRREATITYDRGTDTWALS